MVSPLTSHPNKLQEREESFNTKHKEVSDNSAGCCGVPGMERKAQNRYQERRGNGDKELTLKWQDPSFIATIESRELLVSAMERGVPMD